MNILGELRERFRDGLREIVTSAGEGADAAEAEVGALLEMIRPAQNPQFGDYQANFAMSLGKKLGRPPRELADEMVRRAGPRLAELCQPPEVAGPGFINLRIRDEVLAAGLARAADDHRLGIETVAEPRTFVVDFSSPNVAKAMHVGHIRSTVIGDAIAKTLRFMGHQVITDNHLGDWGTQFGMIIYGYKHFVDAPHYAVEPVQELTRLYKLVRRMMDALDERDALPRARQEVERARVHVAERAAVPVPAGDKHHAKALRKGETDLKDAETRLEELEKRVSDRERDAAFMTLLSEHANIRQAVLDETARLHAGDEENLQLWRQFLPKCREEIQHIYDRLDVRFDQELGESFYHDRLAGVVASLERKGLATESEGATCVFLEGFETPMLIRKRDGAFLYSTSDLATIEYRVATWNPDAILYVVDFRQGEHFGKLFAAAKRWGYDRVDLRHLSFGTVLGEDNRPYKTRSGDTVGLEGLLDEAERRALQVVSEHDDARPADARMSPERRREIARIVGIAAIKYADLSQNRTSDYVFSYDKMLSLQGNTATSMQYSFARVQGIFERAAAEGLVTRQRGEFPEALLDGEPVERQLALKILQFADALQETLQDFRPNLLAAYLYDLSKSFAQFFDACPVLKAPTAETRASRLLLCDLTARTIETGLRLLGIQVVPQM